MEGGGGHVEVAVVAPIGVQQATRAEALAGAGVFGEDDAGLLDGVEDPAEPAHGGADDRGPAARYEFAALLEFVRGEIGPVEDLAAGGQVADGFGMLQQHVAPEHERLAVAGGLFLQEADVVDVLPGEIGWRGVRGALAEVVGFVAAEVEAGRGKAGQEFVEDAAQQVLRVGIAGMDRAAAEALEPGGGCPRGGGEFDFGEVAVLRQREDAAEVAEAGEGGHELDEVLAAERIERLQVGGVVGVAVAGDGGIEAEAEGVLEIELEVVDLERGEKADAALEHFEARDAAAADVEVIAAQRPDGSIFDFQAREGAAALRADLAEGLEGVEEPGGVGGGEDDAGGRDLQPVGFGGAGRGFEAERRVPLAAGDVVQPGKEFVQDLGHARVEALRNAGRRRHGEGARAGARAEDGRSWNQAQHGPGPVLRTT